MVSLALLMIPWHPKSVELCSASAISWSSSERPNGTGVPLTELILLMMVSASFTRFWVNSRRGDSDVVLDKVNITKIEILLIEK